MSVSGFSHSTCLPGPKRLARPVAVEGVREARCRRRRSRDRRAARRSCRALAGSRWSRRSAAALSCVRLATATSSARSRAPRTLGGARSLIAPSIGPPSAIGAERLVTDTGLDEDLAVRAVVRFRPERVAPCRRGRARFVIACSISIWPDAHQRDDVREVPACRSGPRSRRPRAALSWWRMKLRVGGPSVHADHRDFAADAEDSPRSTPSQPRSCRCTRRSWRRPRLCVTFLHQPARRLPRPDRPRRRPRSFTARARRSGSGLEQNDAATRRRRWRARTAASPIGPAPKTATRRRAGTRRAGEHALRRRHWSVRTSHPTSSALLVAYVSIEERVEATSTCLTGTLTNSAKPPSMVKPRSSM